MNAQTLIYCFPHAGAAAPSTSAWQSYVDGALRFEAVRYPGHGHRFCEPLATSIEAIAKDWIESQAPLDSRSTVFFGHSMGSLVAYETCRQLQARDQPLPRHLIVSGRAAPHLPRTRIAPDTLPDDELIDYLRALGGMPPEVLNDAQMCELLVPIARADFAACRHYKPDASTPLPIGVTVYAGDDDDLTPDELEGWAAHTRASFDIRRFAGGHFYLDTSVDLFLSSLRRDVQPDGSAHDVLC
ncbi:thioesterase II family protein [Trinickia diaoshuihuensis]|uniref:thioesterase II family protein n=1 Tax=Trinickia diaoshuihuensis TaxID=2292265 RepID=UPI000E282910|nr:alpha/beta fold hydrolase [Trinickia diaoshuihuensis]